MIRDLLINIFQMKPGTDYNCMTSWLNNNSCAIQAVGSIAAVIVTAVLAYITWRYVSLTNKLIQMQDQILGFQRSAKKARRNQLLSLIGILVQVTTVGLNEKKELTISDMQMVVSNQSQKWGQPMGQRKRRPHFTGFKSTHCGMSQDKVKATVKWKILWEGQITPSAKGIEFISKDEKEKFRCDFFQDQLFMCYLFPKNSDAVLYELQKEFGNGKEIVDRQTYYDTTRSREVERWIEKGRLWNDGIMEIYFRRRYVDGLLHGTIVFYRCPDIIKKKDLWESQQPKHIIP